MTEEDIDHLRAKGLTHGHTVDLFIQLVIELEKLVSSGDLEEFCELILLQVKVISLVKPIASANAFSTKMLMVTFKGTLR